jgi:hypothetical protein
MRYQFRVDAVYRILKGMLRTAEGRQILIDRAILGEVEHWVEEYDDYADDHPGQTQDFRLLTEQRGRYLAWLEARGMWSRNGWVSYDPANAGEIVRMCDDIAEEFHLEGGPTLDRWGLKVESGEDLDFHSGYILNAIEILEAVICESAPPYGPILQGRVKAEPLPNRMVASDYSEIELLNATGEACIRKSKMGMIGMILISIYRSEEDGQEGKVNIMDTAVGDAPVNPIQRGLLYQVLAERIAAGETTERLMQ